MNQLHRLARLHLAVIETHIRLGAALTLIADTYHLTDETLQNQMTKVREAVMDEQNELAKLIKETP